MIVSSTLSKILYKKTFNKEDIILLLQSKDNDKKELFKRSAEIKQEFIGNKVHFRGLIELSNICSKNCLYCGIRNSGRADVLF